MTVIDAKVRNEQLRDHVTRVGFNLTLSRGQITYLICIHSNHEVTRIMSNFIVAGAALRRRGLVENDHGGRGWRLTRAGEMVIGLLQESGIYADYMQGVAL